jgi:hypothetical protein
MSDRNRIAGSLVMDSLVVVMVIVKKKGSFA